MNNTTPINSFRILCIFFFLFLTFPVNAQKEAETYNVAPELYAYYQRCKECLLQPQVLSMADTLFRMAAVQKDKRMQAVALSTQLDYFYYQKDNEDSVVNYTRKVKAFAKETRQPKYYYFAWANRLILFYLKTGKTNIALYEAEKMLQEAQEENDKTGLLHCYNSMSQIYSLKGFEKMCFDWQLKEIELTEKYKLENYNISNTYANVASYYVAQKQQKEALEFLKKATATSNSQNHKVSVKLIYISYYTTFGELSKAQKMLQECQLIFEQDKRLNYLKKNLYSAEFAYYQKTHQYQKALEATNKQELEQQRLNEHAMNSKQLRIKGEIYNKMGNSNEAVKYLLLYIQAEDSSKIENEQRATSEFATLLNVEKLNAEKKELTLQAKEKELRNKTTLIISLIVVLGIVFVFLYRESRLNRKLRISEGELRVKNEELVKSREELRKAKDRAEDNSQMKTTFIQSMSHEIRTPLNSIVGFSQILSDKYSKDDPESSEFVNIIKSNTNDLLRLVSDVLALSELDQYDKLPVDIPTDINMTCQLSLDIAKANKNKEVVVSFTPERKELIILSNQERINQLLTNLMHNAAKFTTQGNINIGYTISEKEKTIQISITDTGIGIPKAQQENVFERFYKTNSFTQGTGLGLPICRSIAEKLGGSLKIDASYTQGCRMILTLPLVYA